MKTTRVFKSGNSQAIRLPKEFQLDVNEVEIFKRKGEIVIRKIPGDLSAAFELLKSLPDDFLEEGREDTPPQERDIEL